jgi:hypothetical protein
MLVCFVFIVALAFSICAFVLGKQYIPAILASISWFVLSMIITRIRYVGDFTVSSSTYYVDAGNPELGLVFALFGIGLGAYAIVNLIDVFWEHISSRRKKK